MLTARDTWGFTAGASESSRAFSGASSASPGRQTDHVVAGAELHDIGKLAVPDAILLKDDPLT